LKEGDRVRIFNGEKGTIIYVEPSCSRFRVKCIEVKPDEQVISRGTEWYYTHEVTRITKLEEKIEEIEKR
jgi:hypothetical protein